MRAVLLVLLLTASCCARAQGTAEADSAVVALIESLQDGSLDAEGALPLLAIAIQQPERIRTAGYEPEEMLRQLREIPGLEQRFYPHGSPPPPPTEYQRALQNYRDGNPSEGNRLFDRAITNAQSDTQRADLYYSRGVSPYGDPSDFDRALEYFPNHGPSLYRRAGLIANSVGRPSSLRGRFAYWCLADIYRNVAASTSDSRIVSASRRAAAQYERAGPSREQYLLEGFSPGQSVTASLGAYGSCTTHVR